MPQRLPRSSSVASKPNNTRTICFPNSLVQRRRGRYVKSRSKLATRFTSYLQKLGIDFIPLSCGTNCYQTAGICGTQAAAARW